MLLRTRARHRASFRKDSARFGPQRARLVAFGGLALLVAAGTLWSAAAHAQEDGRRRIIRRIEIQGLRREPEGDLRGRLDLQIGDPYNEALVSEQVGKLYGTGKFTSVDSSVALHPDGVTLIFHVDERPLVTSIEFRGRDALSEKHLLSAAPALRTRVNGLLSEAQITKDRELLQEKYREAGYLFAGVTSELVPAGTGVKVIFNLVEGSRIRIHRVDFRGNVSVPSGTLLKLMTTREKDFWFFGLLRPGFYDYDVLQGDLENIKQYYFSLGFFDATAEFDGSEFDYSDGRLAITVHINEGPRYTFTGYTLQGNRIYTDQVLFDLTTAVTGLPYDAQIIDRDRRALLGYYGDRAYIEAKVTELRRYDRDRREVAVILEIVENSEIYVDEVDIRGNVKTQDRVIRREVELYPGERVDRSKLVKSRSNLNRLQIFKTVRYSFEKGSSTGNKKLVWEVEEEPSGRLILGFGVTSGFGVIGNFSITKRNFDLTDLPESLYDIPDSFTGAGQTLTLVAQPGTRRSLYRFSLTEPYLFGTRNSLTIAASSLKILRDDYDEDRTSFSPTVAHAFDFDRDFVFSLSTRLEEVEISDLDSDAPADAFEAEGFTTVIAASAGVTYSKVLFEHLEGPYDGSSNAISYERAGTFLGGEVDFDKIEVTNQVYYPIYTFTRGPETLHHVVSLVNRVGFIEPTDSGDSIPIFERFFLGGPNTVRGFRFRGLGPHDGNDPLGGAGMVYGNLEYSFPLFQKLLRGVFFLDYGNLAPETSDLSFGRMRYSIGGGLRINFPFLGQPLPIGLYLGTPIEKEDDDRTRVFLFTIGTPF